MVRKHDSSTRVLTFVLTVAFGLLSAVIAYASFKGGSFELRSKAATEEVILKQWTFDKVAEGWGAKDFLSSAVSGGMYKLTVNSKQQIAEYKQECTTNPKQKKQVCKQVRVMRDLSPRLVNTSVQTNLLYPINKFRIRLSAGSPSSSGRLPTLKEKQENEIRNKPSPPQSAYPITLKVSQKYQGKKVSETEQQISAVADAKEHEYSFDFPKDSSLKRVDELQITFVGLGTQAGTYVSINDISLIGLKEVKPTITKMPPVATQTLTGYVRTYQGEGSLFYKLVLPMTVVGETKSNPSKPVYGKVQEYLLTQNTVNPCGTSKTSKMMCRYFAPAKIDFSKYVDKYVTVTGTILKEDATIGFGSEVSPEKEVSTQAKWMVEDDAIINRPGQPGLPTFVVSTIKLVTTPSISPSPVVSQYPSTTSAPPPPYTSIMFTPTPTTSQ